MFIAESPKSPPGWTALPAVSLLMREGYHRLRRESSPAAPESRSSDEELLCISPVTPTGASVRHAKAEAQIRGGIWPGKRIGVLETSESTNVGAIFARRGLA